MEFYLYVALRWWTRGRVRCYLARLEKKRAPLCRCARLFLFRFQLCCFSKRARRAGVDCALVRRNMKNALLLTLAGSINLRTASIIRRAERLCARTAKLASVRFLSTRSLNQFLEVRSKIAAYPSRFVERSRFDSFILFYFFFRINNQHSWTKCASFGGS